MEFTFNKAQTIYLFAVLFMFINAVFIPDGEKLKDILSMIIFLVVLIVFIIGKIVKKNKREKP
ncbi:hypothetical protein [Neobacillus soli]|uniref:hypothetical protein n=1 Tax=Neobacillus soli TaxID=220688 RepID=UPI0008242BAB|nr:hypothetical protein [Neobacillus soli]